MVQEVPAPLPGTDYWFTVKGADGLTWADIFEFKARYESGMVKQLVDYALRAYLRTAIPVRGFLIVMTDTRFPADYVEIPPLEIAGVLSIWFETVRLNGFIRSCSPTLPT